MGCILPVFASSLQDELLVNADSRDTTHPIHELIGGLRDGDVFLDVGANIGLFSVLASRRVGPGGAVVALEPSRREFQRLLKTLEWNNCGNVQPLQLAASHAADRLALSIASEHSGRNSICFRNCGDGDAFSQAAQAVRLDRLFDCLLPDQQIALCKIDIEGGEVAALKGMAGLLSRKLVRHFCIEVDEALLANAGSSAGELYHFMDQHGYVPRFRADLPHYDEVFALR
jgi:FkbM family methyltransferase